MEFHHERIGQFIRKSIDRGLRIRFPLQKIRDDHTLEGRTDLLSAVRRDLFGKTHDLPVLFKIEIHLVMLEVFIDDDIDRVLRPEVLLDVLIRDLLCSLLRLFKKWRKLFFLIGLRVELLHIAVDKRDIVRADRFVNARVTQHRVQMFIFETLAVFRCEKRFPLHVQFNTMNIAKGDHLGSSVLLHLNAFGSAAVLHLGLLVPFSLPCLDFSTYPAFVK